MKRKLGLIVNPIAGMGGSVGLKGTDHGMYRKALTLGALPVAPKRTQDLLNHIKRKDDIQLLAAPGKMGEEYLVDSFAFSATVTGNVKKNSTAEDTKRTAREMLQAGIELLIFVGGDGTARDIHNAIGCEIPVVAVPSGVKVFSAVFAFNARTAAEMVDAFIDGTDAVEEEVNSS